MIDESIFPNSVKHALWECPVWQKPTGLSEQFNQALLKELYGIAAGIASNSDAYPGSSLLDYDAPCLQELIALQTKVIHDVINRYMPVEQEAVFVPSGSWLNVNDVGERIELHAHPDSAVACTYYVQAPDQGGEFYYVDTGKVGEHKTQVRTLQPATGDLIFFPSYVLHGVNKNRGRLRISLSSDFHYALTEGSKDKLELRSFVSAMLKIPHV